MDVSKCNYTLTFRVISPDTAVNQLSSGKYLLNNSKLFILQTFKINTYDTVANGKQGTEELQKAFLQQSAFKIESSSMMKKFLTAFALLCQLSTSAIYTQAGDKGDLTTLKKVCFEGVNSIHSIEANSAILGPTGFTHFVRQVYMEDMFRTEVSISRVVVENAIKTDPLKWPLPFKITTYDGNLYQEFRRRGPSGILMLSPTLPHYMAYATWALDPLVVPYKWLFRKGEDEKFFFDTLLKNPDAWDHRFENAILMSEDILHDETSLNCVQVQVKKAVPKRTFEIWFAKEQGYQPVKWVAFREDGSEVGGYEVSKSKALLLPDGSVVGIPINAIYNNGGRETKITVLPDSIKVNHSVDISRFTIPPELADRVITK